MKTLGKILIALSVLGIIVIIVGFALGGNIKSILHVNLDDDKYIKQEDLVFQEDVTLLIFDFHERSIDIQESTNGSNYIMYSLYAEKEVLKYSYDDESKQFNFSIKQNPIKFPWFQFSWGSSNVKKVSVFLASDSIKDIDIAVTSGTANVNYDKTLESLNIKVTSGRANVQHANINNQLMVSTTSGNTKIENSTAAALTLNSTSGAITLVNNHVTNDTNITITSGSTTILNQSGENLNIISTSGKITIQNSKMKRHQIRSTSGSVKILEDRAQQEIGFDLDVTSGSITFYGKKRKEVKENLNSSQILYYIRVTSGSITI